MKSTGIVRRVDELGRVVIPIELRNKFGIAEKDPIEIYVDGFEYDVELDAMTGTVQKWN